MKIPAPEIAALAAIVLVAVLGGRVRRGRAGGVLAIAALLLATLSSGGTLVRMTAGPGFHHTWNVFHYYLGAKYFDELGYFDLYTCSLAADAELDRMWGPRTPVRDLRTYAVGPRQVLPPCPRAKFTDERWRAFGRDLRFFQGTTRPGPDGRAVADMPAADVWPVILTDKGFNPSPVWVALGRPLANRVPIDDAVGGRLLIAADAVLLVLALGVVARVHGIGAAALALAFLVSFWGNYQRLLGNLLQYTWLASLVVASCLWTRGRLRTSAACFAWSVTTMIFPVFLASGLALRVAWGRFRGTTSADLRAVEAWLGWVAGFSALLAAVSIVVLPGHHHAWTEFAAKIGLHGTHIHGEVFNVGLRNLVSTCCTGAFYGRFDDIDHLATRWPLYVALAVGLLGLFAAGAVRERRAAECALALGIVPVFVLLTLSRYYYVALVLFVLPPWSRWAAAVLLASNLAFLILAGHVFKTPTTLYYPYWGVQAFYGLFFVWLLVAGLLAPWLRRAPTAATPDDTPPAALDAV